MATNTISIADCVAIGESTALNLFEAGVLPRGGVMAAPAPDEFIGADGSWEQRRAFELSFLRTVFARRGDVSFPAYCTEQINGFLATARKDAA